MVKAGVSLWALMAFAACALIGCGKDDESSPAGVKKLYPVVGCESIDPTPCDVDATACQKKLLNLAACMRGSEPGELPPVTHMTVDAYAASLRAEAAQAEPDAEMSHVEAMLVLLGLAEPAALGTDADVMRAAASTLAFYRDESDDIVLIDHPDADPIESNGTLLHELVHSLQDRESDITGYRKAHLEGSSDAFLAADAIVEGEARFHEYVFDLSVLGYDPRNVDLDVFFKNIVAGDESAFLDEPSPITVVQYVFPYDWGARYVNLAWSDHQSILDLLAAPPSTTHTIMSSSERVTQDGFTAADFQAPSAPDAWVVAGDDEFGAFLTFLMLQKAAGTDEARDLALAWRGDHAFVYAGSEASGHQTSTAFVWSCDFDTAANANGAADVIRGALGDVEVRVSGSRLTVAANDAGSDAEWAFAAPAP
jgi:hypothetical protein